MARAKARATKLGLPFDLSENDLSIPERCPVLGIPLERAVGQSATGGWKDSSPSLDRIIPELGYVRGNVVVVSMRANRLKSNASIDELRRLALFYTQLEDASARY